MISGSATMYGRCGRKSSFGAAVLQAGVADGSRHRGDPRLAAGAASRRPGVMSSPGRRRRGARPPAPGLVAALVGVLARIGVGSVGTLARMAAALRAL